MGPWCWGLVLLAWLFHQPAWGDSVNRDLLEFERAFLVVDSGERIPPPEADWKPVRLPDLWSLERIKNEGTWGWYRIDVKLNVAPNRLWGVLLPEVGMNAAVYLNHELLGDGGSFEEPVARNWNRPLYFTIPNGLLVPGENQIHIRVKADPSGQGYFAPIRIGPDTVVRPVFERRFFFKQIVPAGLTTAVFVLCLMMAVLWLYRRKETAYGWFAAGSLTWAFNSLNLFVRDILVPTAVWDWLWFSSFAGFAIFMIVFVHRFLGLRPRFMERVIAALAVLGMGVMLVLDGPAFHVFTTYVWNSFILAIGLYGLGLLVVHYLRHRTFEAGVLGVFAFVIMGLALHDWLRIVAGLGSRELLVVTFSLPVWFLAFGLILLRRFVKALDELERLNRELDQRVQQKHEQLERHYRRLHELEREQVLAAERERIMRDMHDGIGGHLVSTLALVEQGETDRKLLGASLRKALDDLRLMIDSLETVDGDLLTVLGMLRQRMEPRLSNSGIRVQWEVHDVPALSGFGPQRALHVMRILQEAITNVIKHARADTVIVRTGTERDGVYVLLCDNGQGTSDRPTTAGRGLRNMRRRAGLIGGRLTIDSDQEGTCVKLWLPVRAADTRIPTN